MLFGGVLAAINIQRPKLPHTPFDASLDFFGIAVPSSDRVYDSAGERPDERVITWPLTTGINLGWQYTAVSEGDVPVSVPLRRLPHGHDDDRRVRGPVYHDDQRTRRRVRISARRLQFRRERRLVRAIRTGSPGASRIQRAERRLAAPQRPTSDTAATCHATSFSGLFQKLHLNGGYFGGDNLDRFSRYQFGLFDDTRIHGVPASGVRFDDLAMARGTYTFDLLQLYRFDLFLEQAWGRDLAASRSWQPLTGFGVAFNVRAPYDTILRADVGHAWLPAQYRGIGSTVVQILLLKPLGNDDIRGPFRPVTRGPARPFVALEVNGDLPFLRSRDCYSSPVDVYRVAKSRGMDIVTITDHDSIDGCLELLRRFPDADDILDGEEVSCRLPDGDIDVHLAVYGMTEALHRDVQPLRRNVFDVIARLREADVFFALNHLLHFYRGQVPLETYLHLLPLVPAVEVRNGTMPPAHNLLIERLPRAVPGTGRAVAGSDAHTLRRIGRTWTRRQGRRRRRFLRACVPASGVLADVMAEYRPVAGDAYGVVARYCASVLRLGAA